MKVDEQQTLTESADAPGCNQTLVAQPSAVPAGIMPFFTSQNPSAPIDLYSGPIEICAEGKVYNREARIVLEWSPHTALRAYATTEGKEEFLWFMKNTDLSLRIPELEMESSAVGSIQLLKPCKTATNQICCRLTFQVINFIDYTGTKIAFADGKPTLGRMEFTTDEWCICLDKTPNLDELVDKLRNEGGLGITHTGTLERIDGSSFGVDEGLDVLMAFRWFLAFCRGKFVGIPLVRGVNVDGDRVYEEWSPAIVESWKGVFSWFPKHTNSHTANTFGRFYRLYCNPDWQETLTNAIHWYVNANENVAAIEGSIVLTQIALERMAWTLMVVDKKAISQRGFEKISAADSFNLLFNELNIPKQLPPSLKKLLVHCKRNSINSLAEIITQFRNSVIHPPKKPKAAPNSDVLVEAWRAALWSFELALLSLLKYGGNYVSRVNPESTSSSQTEPLPWAQTEDCQ